MEHPLACIRIISIAPAVKGDWVNQDEILVTLETDKVTVDVRAPTAGFVEETLAEKGLGNPSFLESVCVDATQVILHVQVLPLPLALHW
jgi:glycine cleavage system H lipoate-binding protein